MEVGCMRSAIFSTQRMRCLFVVGVRTAAVAIGVEISTQNFKVCEVEAGIAPAVGDARARLEPQHNSMNADGWMLLFDRNFSFERCFRIMRKRRWYLFGGLPCVPF